MGLEMELDFGNSYPMDQGPKTIIFPRDGHHRPSTSKRNSNSCAKPVHRDDLLKLSEEFLEIDLSQFQSVSCRSIPSRSSALKGEIEPKWNSEYLRSRKIQKNKNRGTSECKKIHMRNAGMIEGRKKIEISRDNSTASCASILDSLCSSDEGSPRKRSTSAVNLISSEVNVNNPFAEIADNSDRVLKENADFLCDEIISRGNDSNAIGEKGMDCTFPKFLSAKLERSHSPSSIESGRMSLKAGFHPNKKMFDPSKKLKSLQNLSVYSQKRKELRMAEKVTALRHGTTSHNDVSSMEKNFEPEMGVPEIKCATSSLANSPIHLHGVLKLGEKDKQGDRHIEFLVKRTEDVLLAKKWKDNNSRSAFNCIYYFHTLKSQKVGTKMGMKSMEKDSAVVGKMQFSCYLHSDIKSNGMLDNSLVMESVLYDISQARRNMAQDRSSFLSEIRSPQGSSSVKSGDLGSASSFPWRSNDRNSELEIAATVIEIPCQKTEKLSRNGSEEKVMVVIPSGSHGLPKSDSPLPGIGPSSLLERWRSGGSCDCGGWDMGCPLTVLGCPVTGWLKDQKCLDRMNHWPLELHMQGSKEVNPTLTMTCINEGHYSVYFHARLSTLQAFSICVAMFHGAKAYASSAQDSKDLSQCISLKTLFKEEVKSLFSAVTKEKRAPKNVEDGHTSYMINPPFSPIARV
ncbi:hypothetical protein SAY86_003785 [Trapa natans]|uniref:Uncharacterized protein n=1 Tax=Trapa natans TaxID=22666 RepID=A0AAN7M6Q2_TRANT|nr:hypothetical protein SAY86_003785 [Trapa natans]